MKKRRPSVGIDFDEILAVLKENTRQVAEMLLNQPLKAETARELCYRLYTVCERKKRSNEAMAYNGLVQSWPEISRLAVTDSQHHVEQSALFD